MLDKIEQHLTECSQCFRFFMLRHTDVADDHGACLAGRKLLPMLPRNGVALVLPSPEDDVNFETRTRAQVAR
jgi:hypothetical protein